MALLLWICAAEPASELKCDSISQRFEQWLRREMTSAGAGYRMHLKLDHLPWWINYKPHRRAWIKIHLPENVGGCDPHLSLWPAPFTRHPAAEDHIQNLAHKFQTYYLLRIHSACCQIYIFGCYFCTKHKYLHTALCWLQSLLYFPGLVMQPYIFTNVTDW